MLNTNVRSSVFENGSVPIILCSNLFLTEIRCQGLYPNRVNQFIELLEQICVTLDLLNQQGQD